MGMLGNLFKGQFIDIVQWADETPGVLVHRFDRHNNEIKNHAKLVVRPGQAAVFVNEGQIADHFGPGTYELTTANMPILTTLLSLPTGFESWHKAEVYFVKTTEQLDRRWGTQQPIALRDQDFGLVRIRAFGNYSYRIGTTNDLLERFVGARADFTAEEIENQFSMKVISEFSDSIGELKIPVLDLPASYNEISERCKINLAKVTGPMGIELVTFTIGNINLPENVNQAIDKRSSMGALGGVNVYMQDRAMDAANAAANNQGGAGNMMGMMMGMNMGGMVNPFMQQQMQPQQMQPQQMQPQQMQPQQMQQAPQAAPPPPPPPPAEPTYYIAANGQRLGPYTTADLRNMAMNGTFNGNSMVWCAGMAGWQAASTVPALAAIFGAVPPPPPPPMP